MATRLSFAFLARLSRHRYQSLSRADIWPFSGGRAVGIGRGQDCTLSVASTGTTTTITPTIGSQPCRHLSGGATSSGSSSNEPPNHVEDKDKMPPPPVLDPAKYKQKIPVRMPDMADGKSRILKWYKQEGDVVLREDVLCDIETPDFVFGMETDDEHPAIMGKIVVEAPSEEVEDDEIICYLMHPSEDKDEEATTAKGDDK